jgi:very-short-patch-repair endonuclease
VGCVLRTDRRIARLAAKQRGVVARRQLQELGLSGPAIGERLHSGRLHPVFRGVYAVGHGHVPPLGLAQAALLAVGEDAVLSHRTAAALWGITDHWPARPDVTVARRSARQRQDIAVHRVRTLPAKHTARRHGLPATTPERTLLDLAEILPLGDLVRALGEAEYRRIAGTERLRQVIAGAPGRHGSASLAGLIQDGPAPTHSHLEDEFLALVRHAGLPEPRINTRVNGHQVDFLWPDQRVVVELDGWAAHGTPTQRARDHARDIEHQLAGYRIMRVMYQELKRRPLEVVARLSALLAGR